ncbi:MAG: PepSY-associated TM helix domain-containing protein [Pseudomonadota bacterium]
MRTDVVKMYKDVHTWVGIVSGLCLFIAFYAGALTMFETAVQGWASPPPNLPAAVSVEDTPKLIAATIAAHPEVAKEYEINLDVGPQAPARMTWHVDGPSGKRGDEIHFASALTPGGQLVVARQDETPVAQWIDVLHQQVGLPFDHEIAMPIMGAISLLYAIALVSGVIAFLPSLTKDLFALRIGRNLKRMWLDVHNVLGVFSLPFHVIMALTAVVFAFHDQFYDTQNAALYGGKIDAIWAEGRPKTQKHPPGAPVLTPAQMIQRIDEQAPGFRLLRIGYATNPKGQVQARLQGEDARYGMRGPTFGLATADAVSGDLIQSEYLPGHQVGWAAAVTGFFTLHFGSFGGPAVRWGYFALGLAGAFLFYSGNLLWIESRRKRMAKRNPTAVVQSRSTQVLGALTIGVALGSVAGVSATLAAAKWLPGRAEDLMAAHMWVYYAVFLSCVTWAFLRGAARAAPELLWACAAATLLVPLSSLLGVLGVVGWVHPESLIVDLTALAGVAAFALMARLTARRLAEGPTDSVWSAATPEPAVAG